VAKSDFTQFTHILASDENNFKNLISIKPENATAEVRLWGSYLDGKSIPDPYYGRTVRDLPGKRKMRFYNSSPECF
jgi:low molecular weight phosphotyrosine protein phosphatase